MRIVDERAIRETGAVRFRSEYDYAVFEYWRSAKILRYLEWAGMPRFHRVLDDGCGGGGMCVSFAEACDLVVGIDIVDRFAAAGARLARERGVSSVRFIRSNGARLPFQRNSFDLVLSHSVIEHVADALQYLREARRVLRPGGLMYLSTAPYLSPAGAHMPRLRVPVPLHLVLGRRLGFSVTRRIGRRHPAWLDVPPDGSRFTADLMRDGPTVDDLLTRVTLRRLRGLIRASGFDIQREDLHLTGMARRLLPGRLTAAVQYLPVARDILVSNMEYLLAA